MTGYDVFVILALLASGAAGWFRGGVRELTAVFSFFLAGLLALITLPWTAPVGRSLVDPDWAGSVLAVGLVFVVLYFGLRFLGSAISQGARGHALGVLDQTLGLGVGLVRALVLVGAVHLIIMGAMRDNPPRWLGEAATAPLSQGSARAIQIVLPTLGKGADVLTPVVGSSVREGFSDQ
ncbi:CvpA family protein [Brevundimonas naejangsanensis]|uniref:CvpA family protein n=1 Tax=Brevundimonas naejangsanensis TaxID=588932 RepID=A0A494RBU9_9CAUL|nr:CvpA family protein [Brevundimonas naejangsanensis]AYG93775.1 CvpA family protein [Brevundimonas naejangsanensis]